MRKLPIAIVGALAASLLFSGCFFLRTLNFSKDKTKVGEPVTATIGLQPAGGDAPTYGIIAVEAPSEGALKLGPGKFDTKGLHGGPYKLVKDEALAAALEADGSCSFPVEAKGPVGELLVRRTEEPFETAGPRRLTEARVEVKPLAPGKEGIVAFAVFSGDWDDDGDGVPEDDEASCTGFSSSSLIVNE